MEGAKLYISLLRSKKRLHRIEIQGRNFTMRQDLGFENSSWPRPRRHANMAFRGHGVETVNKV